MEGRWKTKEKGAKMRRCEDVKVEDGWERKMEDRWKKEEDGKY